MSDAIRDFKDLFVWQKAMDLAEEVYRISGKFPPEEKYALTNQVRRAAVSVPSNLAEGHARQGREFAHFVSVARGSLAEVETQLLLAVRLRYIEADGLAKAVGLVIEIKKMAASLTMKLTGSPREPQET